MKSLYVWLISIVVSLIIFLIGFEMARFSGRVFKYSIPKDKESKIKFFCFIAIVVIALILDFFYPKRSSFYLALFTGLAAGLPYSSSDKNSKDDKKQNT
ncbi:MULTISPECIES: hypothetical protein [Thermoanaerobacterium]|nr:MULTISPECIES: hypothetical protein [Thermoanaerobacterium]KAA5806037.1 hypothetical protein F1655_11255 [Thermoanaerobacterium thermosaccharolyticum]ORX23693.1 hypothetical protein BVF91_05800 [Thermoanaerobacterium sp. PSU-2]HHV74210.1 hypothetical protein [Thermoanaerobacterium sp.]